MPNLRTQFESLLTFLYFIEPNKDLNEIEQRVNEYIDWVAVKSYNNFEKSKNFDLAKCLNLNDYQQYVSANYENIKVKYKNDKDKLKYLNKSPSFLKNKSILAEKFGIKDLYLHIYKEASATIHGADSSDRVSFNESTNTDRYHLIGENGFWPLLLSNLTMF